MQTTKGDDLVVFLAGELFVLVTDTIIDLPQLWMTGSSVGAFSAATATRSSASSSKLRSHTPAQQIPLLLSVAVLSPVSWVENLRRRLPGLNFCQEQSP